MGTTSIPRNDPAGIGRISTLDRFLPAWILAAMGVAWPAPGLATERS